MAQGQKTGGRRKGTQNKATAEKAADIAVSGPTPLEYMPEVMRDATRKPQDIFDAAKAAAPYDHPSLASVEAKTDDTHPFVACLP